MLSLLDANLVAKLCVGLYLMQGIGCIVSPGPDPAILGTKASKRIRTVILCFGSIILATGIAGFGLVCQDWNVDFTLGCAQLVTCIPHVQKFATRGPKRDRFTTSDGNFMSFLLYLLPAHACLTKQECAWLWTRIVAVSNLLHGIQFIMDPSRGLPSLGTPRFTKRKTILAMYSTLGYWLLNYATVLLCITSGIEPSSAIGYGALFGLAQISTFWLAARKNTRSRHHSKEKND